MNCRRAKELMESYIMGDLDSGLAEQLEEHLKRCPECQQYLKEQRRLIYLLRRAYTLLNRPAS